MSRDMVREQLTGTRTGSGVAGGVPAQAGLQRLIVLELSRVPAPSVVDLARRLGHGRPSVSRALSTLKGRGLVEKRDGAWSLTDDGRAEVQAIVTGVPREMKRALERERRLHADVGQQAASMAKAVLGPQTDILNLARNVTNNPIFGIAKQAQRNLDMINRLGAKHAADTIAITRVGNTIADLGGAAQLRAALEPPAMLSGLTKVEAINAARFKAAITPPTYFAELIELEKVAAERMKLIDGSAIGIHAASLAAQSIKTLAPGLDAALAAQWMQASYLNLGAVAGKWWSPALGETMTATSRMAADLAAMESLLGARRSAVRSLGVDISATSNVVAMAHAALTAAVLPSLDALPAIGSRAAIRGYVLPTATTGSFIAGGRRLLEPIARDDDVVMPANVRDLAEWLRRVSPDAAEALLAAWQQLSQRGHDYHRGVAHHGREALRNALQSLAPDSELPKPARGRLTRATRIRYVLVTAEEHDVDWAEAQVEAVLRLFDVLNAEAHVPRLPAQGLAGILESLTGTLRFLLSFARAAEGGE